MSLHPRHPRQPSLFLLTTIWHYSDSHRTVTSSLQKLKKCQNFAYNLHRYHPYSQCAQDDFEIDKRNLARKVEVMKGRAVDLVQLPAELVGMIRGEFEFEDEDEELVEDVRAIAVGLRKEGEGAGSEMEEEVYSESEYDEEEDSEGDSDEDEEEDSEEVEGEEDEEGMEE
ncbi:hypothetical protein ACLMJK_007089 [Lecanora helva]